MKLFITRHGRTNYNEAGLTSGWDDSELTEEGKTQAAGIGNRLLITPPSVIFCSTLKRAFDTAEIISSVCGGRIDPRDALKERNLGVLQGLPEETYQQFLKSLPGDVNQYRPEGGESRDDVKRRVRPLIDEIIDTCTTETVLIVGHHSTNRSILSICLGGEPAAYTQRNGTLTLLTYTGQRWNSIYIDQ